jgi:hypothetical protein
MASVESIREIEVLNLDGVAASGYRREYFLVLTDGGEGRVVLDPAQSVYATLVVSIRYLLMGRASGCSTTAGASSLSDNHSVSIFSVFVNNLLTFSAP